MSIQTYKIQFSIILRKRIDQAHSTAYLCTHCCLYVKKSKTLNRILGGTHTAGANGLNHFVTAQREDIKDHLFFP